MKTFTLIISFLFFGLFGFAQKDDSTTIKRDTTEINIGKSTILFIGNLEDCPECKDTTSCKKKNEDDTQAYLDFGTSGFLAPDFEMALPKDLKAMELNYSRSHSISFSVMHPGVDLIKNRLYLSPGLGFNYNSYSFKNNITISSAGDSTLFALDSLNDYDKMKLRATYIQVPLVLGTRIGNLENPVSIQTGIIGGYKLGSMVKRKYSSDNGRHRERIRDDYNLNPFKLDAIVRIAVGDVGIFARYSLTSLFEPNKASNVNAFAAGITLGDFDKLKKTTKKPVD